MIEKLESYVNALFAPYDGNKGVGELKADLISDLQQRFRELRAEGIDEETAFKMTIESIGEIEQTLREISTMPHSEERQAPVHLNAIDLTSSDFLGVSLRNGRFKASALRGANFAGAELSDTTFEVSDMHGAIFDGAHLIDSTFSIVDLTDASFAQSVFVRTQVNVSNLKGAKFTDARLTDVMLNKSDLRTARFERCTFNNVDFKHCDLRGVRLDGQTFIGVRFDKSALKDVSFRGATLKNVIIVPPLSLTNKAYHDLKTVRFEGAMMDKLTYATLKGLRVVDLSNVTVI